MHRYSQFCSLLFTRFIRESSLSSYNIEPDLSPFLAFRIDVDTQRRLGKTVLPRYEAEAVMNIKRSLTKLHQVFLDMAVLVDKHGEVVDDIEHNVMKVGSFVSGGTNSLFYANQMKKRNKRWVWLVFGIFYANQMKKRNKRWVWLVFGIVMVCIISVFNS